MGYFVLGDKFTTEGCLRALGVGQEFGTSQAAS